MVTLEKITADVAGVWFAGANRGWRIGLSVIEWATLYGYVVDGEARIAMDCFSGDVDNGTCSGRKFSDENTCDCDEIVRDVEREAQQFIDHVTPRGFQADYRDGDYGMWRTCPCTGEWEDECADRHCELHYMSAPLKLA